MLPMLPIYNILTMEPNANANSNANLLWVEKYRPTKIQEYIGNRQTVRDIKSWISAYKDNSPNTKPILILHGHAGVGKTTLAHIIFAEYGFEIVEYNASDNRTKKTIYETVGTIGKFSVSILAEGHHRRQVGLIMDEVDGLAGGVNGGVDELVSIVCNTSANSKKLRGRPRTRAPMTSSTSKNKTDSGTTTTITKAKPTNSEPTTSQSKAVFPVICTCNSIKDKKLAPLLKEALVVKIPQPTTVDLLNMGKRIAIGENLIISENQLLHLVNASNRDYRSFIFNLFQWSLTPQQTAFQFTDSLPLSLPIPLSPPATHHEISETPLGKLGYFINNKDFSITEIMRYIETDGNVYFLGLYANWLTILKDVGFFRNPNTSPIQTILSIMQDITDADIIHNQLYNKQSWECESYKNYIGCINIIAKMRKLVKSPQLFYLHHHSKFNQMSSEASTLNKKFETISAPNSFIGASINNPQSLFYAFPSIKKQLLNKKNYEDVEKMYKTIGKNLFIK